MSTVRHVDLLAKASTAVPANSRSQDLLHVLAACDLQFAATVDDQSIWHAGAKTFSLLWLWTSSGFRAMGCKTMSLCWSCCIAKVSFCAPQQPHGTAGGGVAFENYLSFCCNGSAHVMARIVSVLQLLCPAVVFHLCLPQC